MATLEIQNLNKNFGGVQALHNVNLKVEKGSVHAIIGPNGAGKSTLLNCMVGRLEPDTGSVTFDGHSLVGRALTRSTRSAWRASSRPRRFSPT